EPRERQGHEHLPGGDDRPHLEQRRQHQRARQGHEGPAVPMKERPEATPTKPNTMSTRRKLVSVPSPAMAGSTPTSRGVTAQCSAQSPERKTPHPSTRRNEAAADAEVWAGDGETEIIGDVVAPTGAPDEVRLPGCAPQRAGELASS